MFAAHLCDLAVDLELTAVSPLHIGTGGAGRGGRQQLAGQLGSHPEKGRTRVGYMLRLMRGDPGSRKVAFPLHREQADGPVLYVPASSIRGAFRHLLRVRIDAAASRWRPELEVEPARRDQHEDGDPNEPAYWADRFGNPAVRHLFGTTRRRAALSLADADVVAVAGSPKARYSDLETPISGVPNNLPLMRLLTSNALDRFTMASTIGLRRLAALEVGTRLHTRAMLRGFGWWQAGALAVAIRAFNDGGAALGTRRAVGLGRLKIEVKALRVRYHDVAGVSPATTSLPGIGHVLDRARYRPGARARAEGRYDEHRMFLRDAEDTLDLPAGARLVAEPNVSDLLMTTYRVDGCDLDALVVQASRRLARVVADETEVVHGG